MKTISILLCALALSACAGAPPVTTEIQRVVAPVTVYPVKAEQIPATPAPLPPRPASASAAADVLLAKVCELVGYVLVADPLLRAAANLAPRPLGGFPECERPSR